MEKFKRLLPTILMIVFEVAIGTLLLIDGEGFTGIIFLIFGSLLLLAGVISLVQTLVGGRNGNTISSFSLAISIILLAIGAFFIAAYGNVKEVTTFVATIFGFILVINGVFKLTDALTLRMVGVYNGFTIFTSILAIIAGIVIAFNPFGSMQVYWIVLGITLISTAVLDLIVLLIYGRMMKGMQSPENKQ